MAYERMLDLAVALSKPGMAVVQSGVKEFSPWTLLAVAMNRAEVKACSVAALAEVADLAEAISLAAEIGVSGDWEASWRSENLGIAVAKGLLLRIASDLRAIDALLPAFPRQAAALARGVYEACAWLELVTNSPSAAELYRFYQERDAAVGDRPHLVERRALYRALVAQARGAETPELRPHQVLADTEAGLEEIDRACAELRDELLSVVPTLSKRLRGAERAGPSLTPAQAREALGGVADEYETFFKDNLFRPTCRIVHASDAFDYYDPATGKGVADANTLPGRPGDAVAVVAAATTFTCIVVESVAEYLVQFSTDESPCKEELRVLGHVRSALALLKLSLPQVSPR